MTHSSEIVHGDSAPLDPQPTPIRFNGIEMLALERLVSGSAEDAIEHARSLAAALAGPDRDEVRLRLLSKSLAHERTLQCLLERVLSDRTARGDREGIRTANEALRGATDRLVRLLAAHRLESTAGQRPLVFVAPGNAVQVNVSGA
jgi:hypothetical protein